MASIHTRKPVSTRASHKPGRQKPLPLKSRDRTVGYAFSGSIDDLSEAVGMSILGHGIQTVLIPETAQAEGALQNSKRFQPIGLYRDSLQKRPGGPDDTVAGRIENAGKGEIDIEAYQPDARAKAILRGRAYAAEDLKAAGGAYTVEEVRALLDVSRQAVDKRVNEGTLLAVPGPSGRRRFPTVQFDRHGGLVKGLNQVQRALGFSSPWAVLNFLVNENDHLHGQRPIEVLRQGHITPVVAAASSIGIQGA